VIGKYNSNYKLTSNSPSVNTIYGRGRIYIPVNATETLEKTPAAKLFRNRWVPSDDDKPMV